MWTETSHERMDGLNHRLAAIAGWLRQLSDLLGRALGETMAVTMVVGNRPEIAASLFAPAYTMASVVANEFTEATTDIYLSGLFEIGLVLLGVTVLVNALAQLLLKTFSGPLMTGP